MASRFAWIKFLRRTKHPRDGYWLLVETDDLLRPVRVCNRGNEYNAIGSMALLEVRGQEFLGPLPGKLPANKRTARHKNR